MQDTTCSEGHEEGRVIENQQAPEVPSNKPTMLVDGGSEAPVVQEENTTSGQTFSLDQTHFKQNDKCTSGSDESVKSIAKPTPPVVPRKATTRQTEATMTETEDLSKCEKCGKTFLWDRVHLHRKHKCEPTEETHETPAADEQRSERPVEGPPAATEKPSTSFDGQYLKSGTANASQLSMWKWTDV